MAALGSRLLAEVEETSLDEVCYPSHPIAIWSFCVRLFVSSRFLRVAGWVKLRYRRGPFHTYLGTLIADKSTADQSA